MNSDVAAREIAREQEYVDTVYAQLEKASLSAQELAKEGLARGRIGNEGGLVERDAMVFQAARRMATLDAAHEGLVFGRLDMRPEVSDDPALHRPHRPARRQLRRAADRLARPRRGGVLPGHAGRPAGRRTPPDPAQQGREGARRRGRPARRRGRDRPADRRRGCAARAADPCPRPVDALDRRDHPGRAGPRDPRPQQGRRARSPAAPAPARPSWRCTARRTCSTATAAATRPAACSSSVRPACSCATSSGCCPRSARPRSRCARSARSSTACARAGATSPRSPR